MRGARRSVRSRIVVVSAWSDWLARRDAGRSRRREVTLVARGMTFALRRAPGYAQSGAALRARRARAPGAEERSAGPASTTSRFRRGTCRSTRSAPGESAADHVHGAANGGRVEYLCRPHAEMMSGLVEVSADRESTSTVAVRYDRRRAPAFSVYLTRTQAALCPVAVRDHRRSLRLHHRVSVVRPRSGVEAAAGSRGAASTRGDRVLDLACGTGDIAFEAARCGARVVGLDITTRMIELARMQSGRGDGRRRAHVHGRRHDGAAVSDARAPTS